MLFDETSCQWWSGQSKHSCFDEAAFLSLVWRAGVNDEGRKEGRCQQGIILGLAAFIRDSIRQSGACSLLLFLLKVSSAGIVAPTASRRLPVKLPTLHRCTHEWYPLMPRNSDIWAVKYINCIQIILGLSYINFCSVIYLLPSVRQVAVIETQDVASGRLRHGCKNSALTLNHRKKFVIRNGSSIAGSIHNSMLYLKNLWEAEHWQSGLRLGYNILLVTCSAIITEQVHHRLRELCRFLHFCKLVQETADHNKLIQDDNSWQSHII